MEPTVPTSGQLRKAYTYILNPEKYLRVFLEDGEIPKHMEQKDRTFLEDLLPWSKKLPEGIRKQQ